MLLLPYMEFETSSNVFCTADKTTASSKSLFGTMTRASKTGVTSSWGSSWAGGSGGGTLGFSKAVRTVSARRNILSRKKSFTKSERWKVAFIPSGNVQSAAGKGVSRKVWGGLGGQSHRTQVPHSPKLTLLVVWGGRVRSVAPWFLSWRRGALHQMHHFSINIWKSNVVPRWNNIYNLFWLKKHTKTNSTPYNIKIWTRWNFYF